MTVHEHPVRREWAKDWVKPPHYVYPSTIPEPVCPGCGHDEHDAVCPVHHRKLDPCTCDQETSR
jgi:hypothetical protein